MAVFTGVDELAIVVDAQKGEDVHALTMSEVVV